MGDYSNTKENLSDILMSARNGVCPTDVDDISDALNLIEQQQQRIKMLEREVKYLMDERIRYADARIKYAKYFTAFCWFLEEYGVKPLHSDNHPTVLENQLHDIVKGEREAVLAKLDESQLDIIRKRLV